MASIAAVSWYRSRWALITGAIIVLAAGVALAAPYLLNVDNYRPLIDRFLEQSTGHEVEIGSLRFHLLPTARVQATNIRVLNPEGFPSGNAVVIGSIDLGIALRPLLSRRLEVTRIAVHDVQVNVLHNAAGRSNLSGPPAPDTDEPMSPEAARSVVSLDRVGTITVTNAGINLGPSLAITGLRATMNAIDLRSEDWTQHLMVTANLAGAELTSDQLTKPARIPSGELQVRTTGARAKFSVSLGDARVDGTVEVSKYNPLIVRFGLTVPELNVQTVSQMVAHRPRPAGQPPSSEPKRLIASGTVKIGKLVGAPPLTLSNISSTLRVYTTAVQIDAFSLAGYGGTASGTGVIKYSARGSPAAITARIQGLNLGRLLGALGIGAGKISGTVQANLKLAASLGGDIRRTLAGTGTFAVSKLTARPLTFSTARGSVRISPTSVQVNSFSLSGYGGSAVGSGVVTYSARGMPAAVTARIRGLNLAQFLNAMGSGSGRITGTLQSNLKLSGSLADLRRTAAGSGSFAVTNGSFPGMEMQISLAKLAKAFQIDVQGGTTKFRSFTGNLRIAGQRIYGSNLTLDAVGFVSSARGSVGFDGTLSFTGIGHLVRRAGAAPPPGNLLQRLGRSITGTVARGLERVRVPFTLKGTFAEPQFTLAGDVVVTEEPLPNQPKESPSD